MNGRNTTPARVVEEGDDGMLMVEAGAGDRATIGGDGVTMANVSSHSACAFGNIKSVALIVGLGKRVKPPLIRM